MKTADEMFGELGYHKETDVYGETIYVESYCVISFRAGMCQKIMNGNFERLTHKEILACAQLIKEMDGEK